MLHRSPAIIVFAIALSLMSSPATAHRHPVSVQSVSLDLESGSLEVALVPDRGPRLALVADSSGRWVFRGDTGELVGRSYSIELDNRTPERLKVVVAVDGLNVYDRVPVVGRADRDVGSILRPWTDRTLKGWQVDLDTAQQFVFSPPDWSEGAGRTDSRIGTVEVQVYRERPPAPMNDRETNRSSGRSKMHADEARPAAPEPGLGTTSGDDVSSPVRVVRFEPRTAWPEARAELDYGRRPLPVPIPQCHSRLGLEIVDSRDGVRVVSVAPASTADEAGILAGDVILRVDSQATSGSADVRRVVEGKHRGEYLFLGLRRGSHELALKIRM
jgi:hypothetical protein